MSDLEIFQDASPPGTDEARKKVQRLESFMQELEQVEVPIEHYFAQGKVYARVMYLKKDTVVTGKIHKYEQLNILSKGDVTVFTEKGPLRVQAGFHVVSPPGSKRAFYAHEDSIWTVILGTEEKDVDKIEEHFTTETEQQYLEFRQALENKS